MNARRKRAAGASRGAGTPAGASPPPALSHRFAPALLTWFDAHGRWMGGKEDSYVLILLYPHTKRGANRDIEEIRTDYKRQFEQQSVLRADSVEKVSF